MISFLSLKIRVSLTLIILNLCSHNYFHRVFSSRFSLKFRRYLIVKFTLKCLRHHIFHLHFYLFQIEHSSFIREYRNIQELENLYFGIFYPVLVSKRLNLLFTIVSRILNMLLFSLLSFNCQLTASNANFFPWKLNNCSKFSVLIF